MKMMDYVVAVLVLSLALPVPSALAEEWEKYDKPVPTKVVVRVLSHGAKAMSPHTGALVVIRDARSNKEYDRGAVQGSTGDTTALMRAGYPRISGMTGMLMGEKGMLFSDTKASDRAKEKGLTKPDPYFDIRDKWAAEELKPLLYESTADAAKYETVLNISKPTQIVVEAYGPLMPQHAMNTDFVSTWIFPGEDVTGEGIVLELRGLIVDAQASLKEKDISVDSADDGITVPFFMRMMCGCPIAPKGNPDIPWEAENFKITTQAYYNGKLYHEDVTTSDKLFVSVSSFKTNVPMPKDLPVGAYKKERVKVRIMAAQPGLANYGMDEFNVYLSR